MVNSRGKLRPFHIVALLLFTIWCWQVFWWRDQAVRVTQLKIGAIFRTLTLEDRLEWGAICNGLKDYECASSAFANVVKRSPEHRLGLVNWAIAEAHLKKCESSLKIFEEYRDLGPDGPEALYWQGKCLLQLERVEQAMSAFYASASMSSEATAAPESLIDLLFADGRIEEAFSVIAAMSEGKPSRHPRWREKFAEIVMKFQWKEAQVGEATNMGKSAVRLPSFDGQRFWMPVRYSAISTVDFVTIDLEEASFKIDEDDLMQVPFDLKKETRSPSDASPVMSLAAVQIGPWHFSDVEFKVCRQCTSSLGRAVLERFEVSEDVGPGVRFLTLTSN